MTAFFAHTPKDKSRDFSEWNPLHRHLKNVGDQAAEFAAAFRPDMAEVCRHAGRLHDIGKYRNLFQRYLQGKEPRSEKTRHAAYGAALAAELGNVSVAFAIAGHHAGLDSASWLKSVIYDDKSVVEELTDLQKKFVAEVAPLPAKGTMKEPDFVSHGDRLAQEFYIRMLFSCLTDADVLDAIRFSRGHMKIPLPRTLDHTRFIRQLDDHMKSLSSQTDHKLSTLGHIRADIHEHCYQAGKRQQGFFQLTVPTGGGKTLAGMRFALEHAKCHNLHRVIVVIPYLSIIEQNAEIYRQIFDPNHDGVVVEHHSAVKGKNRSASLEGNGPSGTTQSADNWDAPIIVTTSVQFIESLFANCPSRLRKLHNIARSVILMDEVHTLPHHLLEPLLSVLRELKERYRTTVVFSTATQPAFRQSSVLKSGFSAKDEVHEVIPNAETLFQKLTRVSYLYEPSKVFSWQDLATMFDAEDTRQVLAIVNTRAQARKLYETLSSQVDKGCVFHLSSAMCAEHRSHTLTQVLARLNAKLPCYLISTQVVEAGVDLDFPVVYRAIAPLDSLIQAAGRCNREGKRQNVSGENIKGKVVIFRPEEHSLPSGVYETATQLSANILQSMIMQGRDLNEMTSDPRFFADYFHKLFSSYTGTQDSSHFCLQSLRRELKFRLVSEKAKVIRDASWPVLVPYEGLDIHTEHLTRLSNYGYLSQKEFRPLQRYTVNLRESQYQKLLGDNLIIQTLPRGQYIVVDQSCYHESLGFILPSSD
ncbi:MAG: CRISPR-associated helicase Cas3' [Proteobacteria bacterium]|nr:CRISPR-associated helicase Cas3' [Pseudomonadota bacterium]